MKNIYKKMYNEERSIGTKGNIRLEIMIRLANQNLKSTSRVLDIGCNDGYLLSRLNKCELHGIETNEFAAEKAKNHGIKTINYYFDDVSPIPYKNEQFDIVIAGEIIEHIYDTDYFLSEIHRILKKNGKLILSTPNIASLGRRIFLLFGINPIIEVSPNQKDSSGHIRYFTEQTLLDLLYKADFKDCINYPDVVNFNASGSVRSRTLPIIFPGLSQSLIVECKK